MDGVRATVIVIKPTTIREIEDRERVRNQVPKLSEAGPQFIPWNMKQELMDTENLGRSPGSPIANLVSDK